MTTHINFKGSYTVMRILEQRPEGISKTEWLEYLLIQGIAAHKAKNGQLQDGVKPYTLTIYDSLMSNNHAQT